MKKKTYKIIICIGLAVMLFASFGNVFAATNPDYTPTVEVTENFLESKIQDSTLLDVLANMINAVASLIEYLLGAVFKTLTGDNIFPWADRIIFNGIGFLDINFLNPASNSLFVSDGTTSILGKVVLNVYTTIFSLAVLFLGVAVGIMAIRLAISSIAAEKAKYKQAIVNWATCIVMLFLMHYILAFVFWINEQLVQVASGIFIDSIPENLKNIDYSVALNSVLNPEKRLENFLGTCDDYNDTKNYLNNADSTIVDSFLSSDEYQTERMVYIANSSDEWYDQMGNFFGGEKRNNMRAMLRLRSDVEAATAIKNNYETAKSDMESKGGYTAISASSEDEDFINSTKVNVWLDIDKYKKSSDYANDLRRYLYTVGVFSQQDELFNWIKDHPNHKVDLVFYPNFWTSVNSGAKFVQSIFMGFGIPAMIIDKINESNYNDMLKNANMEKLIEMVGGQSKANEIAAYRIKCDKYIWNAASGKSQGSTQDLIANLGYFFKRSAYVYNTETTTDDNGEKKEEISGWRATKISVTGALLYAIFIFQSCMYFIMYVKRLFYVIMLSMFGPIVVIYDFFMKSAS